VKLLNLGCGNSRIISPDWINLDQLFAHLPEGSPERINLLSEGSQYIDHDILAGPMPFPNDHFDGILASHFFEHFDIQQSLSILAECHRVMLPNAALFVSVPDASYFRKVYPEDRNENWQRLFGQTDPANPIPTFMEAALFFNEHRMLFTIDALWCLLTRAGFQYLNKVGDIEYPAGCAEHEIEQNLNRRIFSLEMVGYKK